MKQRIKLATQIIWWCVSGAFVIYSVWKAVDFRMNPDKYAIYSAPWYTDIVIYGIIAGIIFIACFVIGIYVGHKKETD